MKSMEILPRKRGLIRVLVGIVLALAAIPAGLYLAQDVLLFPEVLASLGTKSRIHGKVPAEVEAYFLETPDGESLEVWRLKGEGEGTDPKPRVAIVLSGNGGTLHGFLAYQRWLQKLGITNYGFDYRGFGHSSGWPSEEGIYTDTDAVLEHVTTREEVEPGEITIVGISIGTGPATRLAKLHKAPALVLFSPYTDIASVVRAIPEYRFFTSLLRYEFPTHQWFRELDDTCIVIAHGLRDRTIRPEHSYNLEKLRHGAGNVSLIVEPEAHHNDLFYRTQVDVGEKLLECLHGLKTNPN